jgi:5-exo-hydroxycamphor dehydrogenase
MTSAQQARRAVVGGQEPVEIWDLPVPVPGPGETRVRLELGGVCGTDVHLFHGDVPLAAPIVLGHEGVGTIESLGEGVTTDFAGSPVAVGDRVYWAPAGPCHRCYACTVLNDISMCERYLAVTLRDAREPTACTYSELPLLDPSIAYFRVPDDTPSEAVIALGCALPTMLQAFERLGGIDPGSSVVVQGCGPVGLAATLLAHLSGADPLMVIGAPAHRLRTALSLGATDVLDLEDTAGPQARRDAVLQRTGGRGVDVAIEAAGALPAFEEGIDVLGAYGRYLEVGLWSPSGPANVWPSRINNQNQRLIGSALAQPRHYYQALKVVHANWRRFSLPDLVSHRFPIANSRQALEAVHRQEALKAVITPGEAGP